MMIPSWNLLDDIGEVFSNNSFKVLGRLNESDIRGCSLMFNQL